MEKGNGLRYNTNKNRLGLIPTDASEGIGDVLTYGANKYTYTNFLDDNGNIIETKKGVHEGENTQVITGANNWRLGMKWSTVIDSLERHLLAFKNGEDNDFESGCMHIDHILTNAAFLKTYYRVYPQGDDRLHPYLNTPRIGLDIDGVLADFSGSFVELAKKEGLCKNDKYTNWVFSQPHWNFPYEWQSLWEKVKKDKQFWLNLKPLIKGSELPFEPALYVTSRSIPTEWTEEWLAINDFPCEKVITTSGKSKVSFIKENNIDIFIDDCFENFYDINKSNIGTACYLMTQPYNLKHDVGYRRLDSLHDLKF